MYKKKEGNKILVGRSLALASLPVRRGNLIDLSITV